MTPYVEIELRSEEILENNLKEIENIVQEKGRIVIPFDASMPETEEVNGIFEEVGFLSEDVCLQKFQLVASKDGSGPFKFGLHFGEGETSGMSKKVFLSFEYFESEEEGKVIRRIIQEEGSKPYIHTHCLFKETLERLSTTDKKVLKTLTSKFLEAK